MTRTIALLFLLMFCLATAMQAQAQAPKPDPELKKLSVFVGHWTYEGESQAGPLGPAGKVTGEQDTRWILGGFYQEARSREKRPAGEVQSLEIDGYDPVNRNFTYSLYGSDGSKESGVYTFSSATSETFTGKGVAGGKQYLIRGTLIFAPDLLSSTSKFEVSTDGKTWLPAYEGKATKTQPAPKK
jgi:hypothetical protein